VKYFLSAFLFMITACSLNGQQANAINPDAFLKAMSAGKIQVLDVRTADEYKSGHINNALQANWLDKNKTVYIYCLSGGRSGAAAEVLRTKGYNVINLEGGINAWKRESKPLVGVDPNAKQTSMASYEGQVRSTNIVLVDFGAEWCPPCKKMEPVVDAFMKQNNKKLTLVKMDGGIETALMKSLKVEALPTFILYKNGKEVKRKQGLVTQEEFNSWLK